MKKWQGQRDLHAAHERLDNAATYVEQLLERVSDLEVTMAELLLRLDRLVQAS